MIHDSIDTIPAKLYFKILETGDLSLLSDKDTPLLELEKIWNRLEDQHALLSSNKKNNTVLNLSKKIETLETKYQAVKLASCYLRCNTEDKQLKSLLLGYGYNFTENLQNDLDTIDRENKAIEIIISRLNKKLPSGNNYNKNNFDDVIMQYSILTGVGFINSNTITISQYYALLQAGNQKIKILENNG